MAGGKAPGEVRNGEQDQAPQAAFLITTDSNGDSSISQLTADNARTIRANLRYVRPH